MRWHEVRIDPPTAGQRHSMAIVQALLALLTRSAGRLLNTAFGWATVMLFGQVPQDRQIYLSIIAFGSVAWIVVVAGVAVPSFATFLLAFVTIPEWVDKGWIRLAMLVAAVVIPAIVGFVATRLVDESQRPRGAGATLKATLKGYPLTFGLALTLIAMTVIAPIMKIRAMLRRWSVQHVPVIIKPEHYDRVVEDVRAALATGGIEAAPRLASWMLRAPTKLLAFFGRSSVAPMAAERLTVLVSPAVEVLLHPSDLVISGRELDAARARAVLSEHLTYTPAYMTWTKEANDVEDRLRTLWERAPALSRAAAEQELREIDACLHELKLAYEEWEVLFRERLLVERRLRPARAVRALAPAAESATPNVEEALGAALGLVRELRKAGAGRFASVVTVGSVVAGLVVPMLRWLPGGTTNHRRRDDAA